MSRSKGNTAETIACHFLREGGFDIVGRNVHSRFGEIDIIALKEGVLHFVEVKSADSYEMAVANITPTKLQRIMKTAQVYMQRHQLNLEHVFDAVIVTGESCDFVENITL